MLSTILIPVKTDRKLRTKLAKSRLGFYARARTSAMCIIELQVTYSTINGAASMRSSVGLGFKSPTWMLVTQ